jgi:hypothetical protein
MGKLVEVDYGDRILRKKSIDYLENTIEINKDESFIKLYLKAIDVLADENLNASEYRMCIKLLPYMRYESGLIAYENGRYLDKKTISEIMKLNIRSIERTLETLTDKKIFARTRMGNEIKYYINPFIFMKGTRINKTLYSMFENSKWNCYG